MIGVLGGGQLGRMLGLAGLPLGERFTFVDPSQDAPAAAVGDLIVASYDDRDALLRLAELAEVVTYEFENVPAAALTLLDGKVPAWPPADALRLAQDRLDEKQLFEKVGLSVPRYLPVSSEGELRDALDLLGLPAVVKTRREGYDGKGQVVVRAEADVVPAARLVTERPCLVERLVPFDRELSIVAVRTRGGEVRAYPLVENQHRAGILRVTKAPAPELDPALQRRAEEHVSRLMDALAYVGVIAVELFEVDGALLGNEMAPRVHNSGHWTIEGAATSQFENHLRAILDLPLGPTEARGEWTMVNLVGELPDLGALLRIPEVHLHLYDKEPRPGRKLGHVTAPAAVAHHPTLVELMAG